MARITKSTTVEQFLTEAKRLRSLADDAEAEFLAYLYDAEQMPPLWEASGLTFLQFLEHTNLCRVARYDGYRSARQGLGEKAIEGVGVHAVVAAGRFSDAAKQQEVISEARAWEKKNGTSISEQSAAQIGRDLRSRGLGSRGHKSYATLAREVAEAHAEVERLKLENAALRAEIKLLRKKPKTQDPAAPIAAARAHRASRRARAAA